MNDTDSPPHRPSMEPAKGLEEISCGVDEAAPQKNCGDSSNTNVGGREHAVSPVPSQNNQDTDESEGRNSVRLSYSDHLAAVADAALEVRQFVNPRPPPQFPLIDTPSNLAMSSHNSSGGSILGLQTSGFANILSRVVNIQEPSSATRMPRPSPDSERPACVRANSPTQGVNQAISGMSLLFARDHGSPSTVECSKTVRESPGTTPSFTGERWEGGLLYLDQDDSELSPYQCLLRKQFEIFENRRHNVIHDEHIHGRTRTKLIRRGQVGIRCRHCSKKSTYSSDGAKCAIAFPSSLLGIHHAAENMTKTHLLRACTMVPERTKRDLIKLRKQDKPTSSKPEYVEGLQKYWASALQQMGLIETPDHRLKFSVPSNKSVRDQGNNNPGFEPQKGQESVA